MLNSAPKSYALLMSRPVLRVVFDTNAFAPGNFELLENGPLLALCKSRRILPIYGHVFLEETFGAYGVENKRKELIEKWSPFVAKTVDRFCDDFVSIWHRELVQGRGPHTNIFMPRRNQEALLARLPEIPLDGTWRAWHASKEGRDIEDAKRSAQRDISKSMRQEVANWKRAVNYHPNRHHVIQLDRLFEMEVDQAGREFIGTLVKCVDPSAVADRWSRAKGQYPYFTTFVVNMIYIAQHAITKPNDKIDLNAQADLDLMTHLLRADALVSNESGFLRQAFDDLWRPRGKVLFTSQQFADFLTKL